MSPDKKPETLNGEYMLFFSSQLKGPFMHLVVTDGRKLTRITCVCIMTFFLKISFNRAVLKYEGFEQIKLFFISL